MLQLWRNYLHQTFYLDLRSLAVFRILMASLILYNIIGFIPYIDPLISPDGIYPFAYFKTLNFWSLYRFSGHLMYIYVLFFLNIIAALMLLVGFKTKLATVLCFIFQLSLSLRNPIINFGGDLALQAFLAWSIFLPLGARMSLDASHKPFVPFNSHRYFSMATVGLICQLVLIYITTGVAKTSPQWTQNFTALNFIYNTFEYAKPIDAYLKQFPSLLMFATMVTKIVEITAVLLLLVPYRQCLLRSSIIILFILFHGVILLTMEVGWFSQIMIIGWIALIPFCWWDKQKSSQDPVIINSHILSNVCAGLFLINAIFLCQYQIHKSLLFKPWHKSVPIVLSEKLRLNQRWNLFSPGVVPTTRFYQFIPVSVTGEEIRGSAFENLHIHHLTYYRWMDYYQNSQKRKSKILFKFLRRYLMRHWRELYPEAPALKTVRIFYTEYKIDPVLNKLFAPRLVEITN